MTDRLKEWLDEQDGDDLNGSAGHKVLEALRAVVELHRHVTGGRAEWCEECGSDVNWPCPTLRAIEKEVLK